MFKQGDEVNVSANGCTLDQIFKFVNMYTSDMCQLEDGNGYRWIVNIDCVKKAQTLIADWEKHQCGVVGVYNVVKVNHGAVYVSDGQIVAFYSNEYFRKYNITGYKTNAKHNIRVE